MPDSPFDEELIIRYLDRQLATQFYYGFDLSLGQRDVPYTPVAGSRPPSDYHFVVCGDTVTISEPLVNPGRDVVICAREVVLAPSVTLDVSGGDPATDFAGGSVPQQTDTTAGAAGAAGQDAATGSTGGSLRVLAETIRQLPVGSQALATAVAATLRTNALGANVAPSGMVLFPDVSVAWTLHGSTVTIELPAIQLTGSWSAVVDAPGPLQDGAPFTLAFTLGDLRLASPATIWLPGSPTPLAGSVLGPVALRAAATLAIAADSGRATCSQVVVSFESFAPALAIGLIPDPLVGFMEDEFGAFAADSPIHDQVQSAFQEMIGGVIDTVCGQLTDPPPLLARGGRGGRGQDGHGGNRGAQGSAGTNNGSRHWAIFGDPPPQANGGTGSAGGTGGAAGASGEGGAGGAIEFRFVRGSAPEVSTDASGGPGGAAASGGQGGPGGDGGPAGSYTLYVFNPEGGETNAGIFPGLAGAAGSPGAVGRDSPAGASGGAGTVDRDAPGHPSDYAALAWAFPLDQLLIEQRVAAMRYLNAQSADDYAAVVQTLGWLLNLTTPLLDGTPPSGSAWTADSLAVARSINAAAAARLAHLRAGLDYYGHPGNWVPLRSLSDYETALATLLASGKDIEAQFDAYKRNAQAGQPVKDQLTQTSASLVSAAAALAARVAALDHSITDAQGAIDALTARLQQQRTIIALDQVLLEQEFDRFAHADNCTFRDVLDGVEKVMTLGAGLADGMGEISAALDADEAIDGGKLFKGVKDGLAAVLKVDVTITDLQTSIDAIGAGLTAIGRAVPPSNPDEQQALLLADQQRFDGFIGKFLDDFSAAATLKQDVDDYFAMIRARNQAIVTYNGLYATRARLQAQQAQSTSQVELMAAQLANAQPDPTLPINLSFMRSALTAVKEAIVAQLYEKNRAYWYWSLVDQPLVVDDLTVAALASANDTLDTAIDDVKGARASVQQGFTQTVAITAEDFPSAFAQLWRSTRPNRRLSFAMTPEKFEFANPYRVLVNQFTLSFPDLTTADAGSHRGFNVYLVHPGTAFQLTLVADPADPSRRTPARADFCHTAIRDVSYTVELTPSGGSGGGAFVDEGSVGVSPYTQWTLDFEYPYPFPDEDWLTPEVLAKIKSVQITFTGSFISPSPDDAGIVQLAASAPTAPAGGPPG